MNLLPNKTRLQILNMFDQDQVVNKQDLTSKIEFKREMTADDRSIR